MNSSQGESGKAKKQPSGRSTRRRRIKENSGALDLGDVLGAAKAAVQSFSIYVPNRDRNGKRIKDHGAWVLQVRKLLAEINGGSTAMPPTDGMWLYEESEQMIEENTVVVYSFIEPDRFAEGLPRIRQWLHRFGRETNQGEVSCECGGFFYRIVRFDEPGREVGP